MKPPPLTIAGVCSGIGGFDLGFDRAGFRVLWTCEKDAAARLVLQARFPDGEHLTDMLSDDLLTRPHPAVLLGGTPCQGFSVAGLRRGLADDRSNLALRFCALAVHFSGSVVVWENVPGVLSMPDNAFGCFLAALVGADAPLVSPDKRGRWPSAGVVSGPQRTAAWRVLDAQYFGVAQRRRRVFLVADPGDGSAPEILFEREGLRRDSPPRREAGERPAPTLSARTQGGGGLGTDTDLDGGLIPTFSIQAAAQKENPAHGPDSVGVVYTLEARAEVQCVAFDTTQITSPANVSVPKAGDPCHPLAAGAHPPAIIAFQPRIARNGRGNMGDCVNALQAESGTTGKGDAAPCVAIAFPERLGSTAHASAENVSPCLGAVNPTAVAIGSFQQNSMAGKGTLGYDPDTQVLRPVKPQADHQMLVIGEPPVVGFQSSQSGVRLVDIHATLDANNGPRRHNGVVQGYQVRRLTPRECDRLQGFPDDWGLVPGPHGKPMSDSQRYKQLGNAVNVAVSTWLAQRIAHHFKHTPHPTHEAL
jgi:DNA (cytosine-5)-methyltransferase 1